MHQNPNDICLFNPKSDCKNCNIREKIICKNPKKERIVFTIPVFIAFFVSLTGFLIYNLYTELIIFLVAFIGLSIFFFCFFEIKVLCSHCPYYAEDAPVLHCFANYGSPKFWGYDPKPMNIFEKIGLIFTFVCFGLLLLYPVYILMFYQYYLFSVILLINCIIFFILLQIFHCPRCPNFSCPFNRVDKKVIDEFLSKNPIMKKAWDEKIL